MITLGSFQTGKFRAGISESLPPSSSIGTATRRTTCLNPRLDPAGGESKRRRFSAFTSARSAAIRFCNISAGPRSPNWPKPVPGGPTVEALVKIARDLGVVAMAGLIEIEPSGRLFNCDVTVGPEDFITTFMKVHMVISPFLDSGDSFNVIDLLGIKAGFLTCYGNNLSEDVRMTTPRR